MENFILYAVVVCNMIDFFDFSIVENMPHRDSSQLFWKITQNSKENFFGRISI